MDVQQKLFPDRPPPPAAAAATLPRAVAIRESKAAPVWLQRVSMLVLVLFCIYLGVIVAVLPWWRAVWDHNLFLTSHARLWSVLRLGPVRGVISGLGLLDIWIGVSEAAHYRDDRAQDERGRDEIARSETPNRTGV